MIAPRPPRRRLTAPAALADAGASLFCLALAYAARDRLLPELLPGRFPSGLYPPAHYLALFLVAPALRALAAAFAGREAPTARPGRRSRALGVGRILALEAPLLGALGFLFQPLGFSRALVTLYLALSVPALALRQSWIERRVRRPDLRLRVAILGAGRAARALARWLRRRAPAAVECVGLFGPPDTDARTAALPARATDLALDEVLLAAPASDWHRFAGVLEACREVGLAVRLEPRALLGRAGVPRAESLLGLPTLVLADERAGPRGLAAKRAFDLLGSLVLLIALAPVFAATAAAVWICDGPPILFRQVRVGRNGRRFTLLKFRTMAGGAGAAAAAADAGVPHLRALAASGGGVASCAASSRGGGGAGAKRRDDPRVTRLGRWLRRHSLDELPQLYNVLRGDMSFVGPRPPLPEEVEGYEPWQRRRLRMPPGLTGPAQVRGRGDLPFEAWARLDLEYVERWSLALDARILLRTIPAVLSGRGAY
jgi:exopolysaccharide biosynthesis polyprenyl glycosylphosphotransferase